MSRQLCVDQHGFLSNRVFLDDPHLHRLLAVLDIDGESARVVGGAVRNAALGLSPGDIDVATTALPHAVMARAKAAGFRVVPTGVPHGTVTVLVGRHPFEVTTLREDVETNGRHAVVSFGRDYAADAARRDFTINALSVDAAGRIHDQTGGLADLAAGRVRFIGDPATRIREDFLRILRFFRFSATYATAALDAGGLAACRAESTGLSQLSRERVRAETLKLIAAPRAPEVLAAMEEADLLGPVLGAPGDSVRFGRLRAIETARAQPPDALLGLAALAVKERDDVHPLRDRLRLSNGERDRLDALVAAHTSMAGERTVPDARVVSGLLYRYGRQAGCDAVTMAHVDSDARPDDPQWLAAARFAAIAALPALPVSGADIMARGVRRGPLVGQVLKALQALWIRAGFPENPAELHDLLDQAIASTREPEAK